MNLGVAILWFIAIGLVVVFCKYILFPTIRNKWFYWRTSRVVGKMAKKYKDQEAGPLLDELSQKFKKAAKEESIFSEDEDEDD